MKKKLGMLHKNIQKDFKSGKAVGGRVASKRYLIINYYVSSFNYFRYYFNKYMFISIKIFIGKTDVILDNLVCTQINDVCERSPCRTSDTFYNSMQTLKPLLAKTFRLQSVEELFT